MKIPLDLLHLNLYHHYKPLPRKPLRRKSFHRKPTHRNFSLRKLPHYKSSHRKAIRNSTVEMGGFSERPDLALSIPR